MSLAEIPVSSETFPAQLKQLRQQRDWTQRKLADEAKVSQQTISAIEQGKMEPSLKVLLALAIALGVFLLVGAVSEMSQARMEVAATSE